MPNIDYKQKYEELVAKINKLSGDRGSERIILTDDPVACGYRDEVITQCGDHDGYKCGHDDLDWRSDRVECRPWIEDFPEKCPLKDLDDFIDEHLSINNDD